MGDWRGPRNGLTKRERGIPSDIFDEIVVGVGFKIERRALCDFAPLSKLLNIIGISVSKSKYLIKVDAKLSSIFSMNLTYHRTSFWEKVAPGSIFYVLSK